MIIIISVSLLTIETRRGDSVIGDARVPRGFTWEAVRWEGGGLLQVAALAKGGGSKTRRTSGAGTQRGRGGGTGGEEEGKRKGWGGREWDGEEEGKGEEEGIGRERMGWGGRRRE